MIPIAHTQTTSRYVEMPTYEYEQDPRSDSAAAYRRAAQEGQHTAKVEHEAVTLRTGEDVVEALREAVRAAEEGSRIDIERLSIIDPKEVNTPSHD